MVLLSLFSPSLRNALCKMFVLHRAGFLECSENGFAFGGQSLNVMTNELLQVRFALDEELATDPGELVCPGFGHVQGELFDVLFADQLDLDFHAHGSSSSLTDLYLIWPTVHSCGATSSRRPM